MGHTCDAPAVVLDFVTIHANLVTTDDSVETVLLTEALSDIGSELKSDTTFAGSATFFLLRISPEHLHHQARLAWLALVVPVELANIVQCYAVVREEATVENKVLGANQCCEGQG